MQDSFYGWPASGQIGSGLVLGDVDRDLSQSHSQSIQMEADTGSWLMMDLLLHGLSSSSHSVVQHETRREMTMLVVVEFFAVRLCCVYVCGSGSFWAGKPLDRRCGRHVLVDVVVSTVKAMEDEGWHQRSGYGCYSRTFPACTPPDSLEGIISTMSATVLQMEQSRAESSPSTMLIEFFLHAYCPVLIFCFRPRRYGCIRGREGSQQLLLAIH